jgi:hypothetical protein
LIGNIYSVELGGVFLNISMAFKDSGTVLDVPFFVMGKNAV